MVAVVSVVAVVRGAWNPSGLCHEFIEFDACACSLR